MTARNAAWLVEPDPRGAEHPPLLVLRDIAPLHPGPGELLLGVRAIGLNRADLSRRAGHYERIATRPPVPVAGLEAAGVVLATGAGVTGFAPGDRVMGMPSGAYARQALLHAALAMRVPEGLDDVHAAALPVGLFTAHDALVTQARLRPGDRVLVLAAASGVGIAALQVARALGARQVIGTGTRPERAGELAALGLTHFVDARGDDLPARVAALTDGHGVDVVVDMVGAAAIEGILGACALGARWVQVGRMGGLRGAIDLDTVSRKRIRLIGVTFRTRDLGEFGAVVRDAERELGPWLASGAIAMPVARVFPFEQADAAQALMRANGHFGKIVLEVRP
jgi:NADPH2:quinone reductase